uniref:Protein sprouty homolog 2 n=1 Tax=Neogobius melanostomus TaxID=47308 RepID=A0A8C6SC39_9GOBI
MSHLPVPNGKLINPDRTTRAWCCTGRPLPTPSLNASPHSLQTWTGSSPGESPLRGSPLSGPHDVGRTPCPPESEDVPEQAVVSRPVLSLEHIKVTVCSNEYTDGPTAACPRTEDSAQERINNLQSVRGGEHSTSEQPHGPRTSGGSPASRHRTEIIRVQPKGPEQSPEELKPLNEAVREEQNGLHKHWDRCEECSRCRCSECVRPRVLPSCWLCGRRCMCSAQSAVEYGTCVCCVKGLFYHCSSDDEDTCADKPFSCSQTHCCARWATVSLLSLFFPCLLCYLPARACVHACQSCYDLAARPGCRCGTSLTRLVCVAAGGIVDSDLEDQYINVEIKLLKSD